MKLETLPMQPDARNPETSPGLTPRSASVSSSQLPRDMMKQPMLSVVTVFWNGRAHVEAFYTALERCRRLLPFDIEAIAIDNGSKDGTGDAIESAFPWVLVIRNEKNQGFAPASNQGLDAAHGRCLLLLNPDCEASPEALKVMVEHLVRNPKTGAVGCALLHGDGLPQHSFHHEPSWWSYWGTHSLLSPMILKVQKLLHALGPSRQKQSPRWVDWLMGACLMVPRRALSRVGGLDPEYFMYSEDADWCRRIRDAGWNVVHLPGVSMVHHHGTTARRRPEFTFRRLYRSLLMYSQKHLSRPGAWALRTAIVLDMVMRIPVYRLKGDHDRLKSVRRILAMYRENDPGLFPDPVPGEEKVKRDSGSGHKK